MSTLKKGVWRLGAGEIVSAIAKKEISCQEAVRAHLDRIQAVNPKVNAVTVALTGDALRAAEVLDRKLAQGEEVGPLAGLPFTVKENIDLAGSATTFGLAALKAAIPAVSAPHVAQLVKAGAIPLARTNLSELGLRPHTANPLRGATLNPWDPQRTPGGSSGGDAAAVATGMTPLGLGNDYGGSLRTPAQFCGVAAIKPSWGRVPDHMSLMPSEPAISMQLFMCQGPLARQVRDLRLALRAMCGGDWRDPQWAPVPFAMPAPDKPIRVAMALDPAGKGVDAQVAQGVRRAGQWLEQAGYVVEEVDPPLVWEAWQTWGQLTSVEIRQATLPAIKPIASAEAVTFLENWLHCFPENGLATYMGGLAQRNRIAREWARFMQKYPLVIGPVLALPTPRVDFDIRSLDEAEPFMAASRLIMAANLLGLPAAAIPVGLADGLPQSVQIIGARFREDMCLDAAEAVEQGAGRLTPIDPVE
ncbi:hypothetical protein AAU61_19805 [Desulfocarbo indianensis]|nr:hypothetical protein AAU61_19805 [Desulfocarbo indianensis]